MLFSYLTCIRYQLSHSSSFVTLPPLPFPRIAAVPIALLSDLPKLSQKSFLLSSIGPRGPSQPSGPSTNRLRLSVAPLAPLWAVLANWAAVRRACCVMSDSTICREEISEHSSLTRWKYIPAEQLAVYTNR